MTLEVLQRFMTAEESTASLNSQLVYINERLTAIFFFGTWYKVGYSSTYSTVQKFKKRHGLNLMCTELTVNKLASKGSRCCAQHNVLQLVHRTI